MTWASIRHVVPFPLLPVTRTDPRGIRSASPASAPGSMASATAPGAADPFPWPSQRMPFRAALPADTASAWRAAAARPGRGAARSSIMVMRPLVVEPAEPARPAGVLPRPAARRPGSVLSFLAGCAFLAGAWAAARAQYGAVRRYPAIGQHGRLRSFALS